MLKIIVFAMIISLALGASLMDFSCPDTCTCQDNHQKIKCHSYIFIKKLLPKQMTTIQYLTINNSSIINIDPKLKYLKNLEYLDLSYNNIELPTTQFPYLPKLKLLNLSHNHLKDIKLSQLPKSLEIIDLSLNSIQYFPTDYKQLKELKELNLNKNPIDCSCHSLSVYEDIINHGISIRKEITCHSPSGFHGRYLHTVNCSQITDYVLNSMLGDEAGSGNFYDETDTNNNNSSLLEEEENEFITATNNNNNTNEEDEKQDEDEGSGIGILYDNLPPPKACHFNCSTAKPVGLNDEKYASPLPPLKEQLEMLGGDLFGFEKDTTSTTTTTSSTTTVATSESPIQEVSEVIFENDKKKQVETFPTNDTILTEMERASVASKESNPYFIFIVLGLVTALVIFLVIYYISKKKKSRVRRNKSIDNGMNGEELKPLGKSAQINTIEIKPTSPSPIPIKDEKEQEPLLTTTTTTTTNNQNGVQHKDENGDVELRNNKNDLLTPQLERVTIKVGEIPDSIPKTPLLVHRQLNSDGEMTTTIFN